MDPEELLNKLYSVQCRGPALVIPTLQGARSLALRFGQGGGGIKSHFPSLVPFPLSYKYTGHQNVCSHSSS